PSLAAIANASLPGGEGRGGRRRAQSTSEGVRWCQAEALTCRENKRQQCPFMSVDYGRERGINRLCFTRGAWPETLTNWPAWRRSSRLGSSTQRGECDGREQRSCNNSSSGSG